MQTELDSLIIKDFESRYSMARSNVTNRLAGLKQQGYDLEPEKQEGRNGIESADQIALQIRCSHEHGSSNGFWHCSGGDAISLLCTTKRQGSLAIPNRL
jgi:hypothetical protein